MKKFIECPECGVPIIAVFLPITAKELQNVKGLSNLIVRYKCDCGSSGFDMCEGNISEYRQLKALSIKQPWAWLIVNGYKPLENRNTLKNFRGKVLIHASKRWDNVAPSWLRKTNLYQKFYRDKTKGDARKELGGIVGAVTITDSITESDSPWFVGPNAFVLTDPIKLPFTPCKGQLGFFKPKID